MPFALVLVLVNATLIIHAAKSGRFWPWAYVILLLPGFGAIGYVIVELVPADAQAAVAKFQPGKAVPPSRRSARSRRHHRQPCGAGGRVPGTRQVRRSQTPLRAHP